MRPTKGSSTYITKKIKKEIAIKMLGSEVKAEFS